MVKCRKCGTDECNNLDIDNINKLCEHLDIKNLLSNK